jgi:hypothetical protein
MPNSEKKLSLNDFIFSCDNSKKYIYIKIIPDIKNYHAVLMAHDEHGKIITKMTLFFNNDAVFSNVTHPIFCLITNKKPIISEIGYFTNKKDNFVNLVTSSPVKLIKRNPSGKKEFYS